MKICYKRIILYSLISLILIAFGIIFGQYISLLIVFVLIILVPVSVFSFKKSVKHISFGLSSRTAYVEIPNEPEFIIEYRNSSFFRLLSGDLYFTICNRYYPNDIKECLSIPLIHSSFKAKIPVTPSDIGLISLRTSHVTVYDYLHFISYNIPFTSEVSVPVLPIVASSRTLPEIVPNDGIEEFEETAPLGMVSTDIKEIREYRPGDRLQRIHWKLSAKLDDLFVKEMANTSALSIVLLPELDKDYLNDTVSTSLSCIKQLTELKERFEICIFNQASCEFSFMTITGEDETLEALTVLYCQPLYEGRSLALDTYLNSDCKTATIIHIHGKKINIGDQYA